MATNPSPRLAAISSLLGPSAPDDGSGVHVHVDMSPLNELVGMFRSMLAADGSLSVSDRTQPRP